ncbi:MAG: serine--tRNA ligase [Candidatus Muiribacterium halophilum]|uniref:Serine--tRNA ligase n=1 Tax=Muiribacterium halophilum TaxID=2053465 RepID=A0A2N5ZGA2_MUIH1|nr:MAG: serine--tRNA ligase [Candidatus Muirbacterium halophilum]
MLDIKMIRENPEEVEKKLKTRDDKISWGELLELDKKRKENQAELDELKSVRNKKNKEIAKAEDKKAVIDSVRELSSNIKDLEMSQKEVENSINEILAVIPNIPSEDVPISFDEEDAKTIKIWGDIPEFDFEIKDHVDIADGLKMLDFERAAKMSGARFALYRGEGARLERALLNFMLDVQTTKHGYTEFMTPYLVNAQSLFTTSNLPKFEEDLFKTQDDLYLLPTSEVSLVNIHRDDIISQEELPIKYTGYTPCFRREAGSYGKDLRGLIRTHQFNKVELVQFVHPDRSSDALEEIVSHAEKILELLNIPYRRQMLVTGDISNASSMTIDLEVWIPTQNKYREVSSCSNCTDFQARRGNIRFKEKDGKLRFVHTLNGSGLATSRLLPAIIELNQTEEGYIIVPEVLRPYMNGIEKIAK